MPVESYGLHSQLERLCPLRRNSITQTAFFFLIQEEKRSLTKTIFRLASISPDSQRISFDEYLCCICSFASLTEGELLRFFYDVYTDESASGGAMGESEILKLGKELQAMQSAFPKNVGVATRKMASSRDVLTKQTLVTFDDFQRLSRLNSVAFYPLYQMQRNMRIGSLGEEYWIEKTREKVEVDRLLKYMVRNNGREIELDWKTRVIDFVFRRESLDARVRRRARALYDAQYRHLRPK